MFYLIYLSTATRPMNKNELLFLLHEASGKNNELDITGMLLYQDGTFMQMIEGEKQAVLELYKKIITDDRHKDVHTMLTGVTEKRNFKDWSMGFFDMEKSGEFPPYDAYIKKNINLKLFNIDSLDAYMFMSLFTR